MNRCVAGAWTGRLQIKLHQGRALTPKDRNGVADPYAVLCLDAPLHREQTAPRIRTLNPAWNFEATFPVTQESRRLTLEVWDKDETQGGGERAMLQPR